MKTIVVGCGKIGSALAEGLVNEGHDVTIIDQSEEVLKKLASKLDIMGVQGNGAVRDVLYEAGVKDADVVIAATASDEVNILCCMVANKCGHASTVARIRNPEYEDQMDYFRDELKITQIINPEKMAAKALVKLFRFPSAIEFDSFGGGRVDMIKIRVTKDSPLCAVAMKDFPKKFWGTGAGALVCMIERGDQVIIPKGATRILADDCIFFVAKPSEAVAFCKKCNLKNDPISSAILIGGGRITWFIADTLKSERKSIDLKVIESNGERADYLAENFPNLTVILGDGTSQQLLLEEGVENTDAVITLTGNDEVNIVAGLMASHLTKARRIVKVNRLPLSSVIRDFPLDSVMSPREVVRDEVVRHVRGLESSKDMDIESLHTLSDGRVEALEFIVKDDKKLVNIPLKDLPVKQNVLVAAILRGGKVLNPGGADVLLPADHVIIITTNKGFRNLSDILE